MANKLILLVLFSLFLKMSTAQLIDVQADYNSIGDCVFSANNNTKAPLYLQVNFADLQNTSFPETLPYVKRITPGFNALFTLQRDLDADVPRFNYDVTSFRSNPMVVVDLNFPYLIPLKEGSKIHVFDVKTISGFWGNNKLGSWSATGFNVKAGDPVFACRSGIVVEVTGAQRIGEPLYWYNTWTNNITLLHADGTLICYHNVVDKQKELIVGNLIYAGQMLGEIAPNANKLQVLLYHESINKKGLAFIIPQFVIEKDKIEIVNSLSEYTVVHPVSVRGLEMSKRERKKILGVK